jgi:F-type H+-transporting ATPase subunit gamma
MKSSAKVTFLAGRFHPSAHAKARKFKKRGVIVVATDKGLCGALNSNLLREAAKYDKETTTYITAGRKAPSSSPDKAATGGRIHL